MRNLIGICFLVFQTSMLHAKEGCKYLNYAEFTGRAQFKSVVTIPSKAEAAVMQSQIFRGEISNWIARTKAETISFAEARKGTSDPARLKEINEEYKAFTAVFDAVRVRIMENSDAYLHNLAPHLKTGGRDASLSGQERTSLIHIFNNLGESSGRPDAFKLEVADSWAVRPTITRR